jgi:hypothetical protein
MKAYSVLFVTRSTECIIARHCRAVKHFYILLNTWHVEENRGWGGVQYDTR